MSHEYTLESHIMTSFFAMMDRACQDRMSAPEVAPAGAICGLEIPLEAEISGHGPLQIGQSHIFVVSDGHGDFSLTYFPDLSEEQKTRAARIAMEVSLLPLNVSEELKSAVCTLEQSSEEYINANILYLPGVAYVRRDLWESLIDDLELSEESFDHTQNILNTQFLALRPYHASRHAGLAAREIEQRRLRILTDLDPVHAVREDPTSPRLQLVMRD